MYRIGRLRLYVVIIITLLIESTVLNLASIGGIRPNLMLVLIIFVALHSDWRESLEAGIVAGVSRGIMTSGSVGTNLVIFGLCGLLAASCRSKVYKDNFLTQIILTFLIALALSISSLFVKMVLKDIGSLDISIWQSSALTTTRMGIYTALFAPPLFFCLRRIFRVEESGF